MFSLRCHNLVFFYAHCSIQEIYSKTMIGHAKLEDGLFLLQKNCSDMFVHSIKSLSSNRDISVDLWHYRLGHVSVNKINHVTKLDSTIDSNPSICENFPKAKQKCLPFPSHEKCSTFAFELFHVDVWGPYSQFSLFDKNYFLNIANDFS